MDSVGSSGAGRRQNSVHRRRVPQRDSRDGEVPACGNRRETTNGAARSGMPRRARRAENRRRQMGKHLLRARRPVQSVACSTSARPRERREHELPAGAQADRWIPARGKTRENGDSMKVFIRVLIAVTALLVSANAATAQQETPKVSLPGLYDEGFLMFRSADSAFAYWLDGRMQIDGALYRGNDNELGGGTEIRRARLGVKATLYRDWHGEFDVDFAENAVEMKDMWVGYLGFQNSLVKAGNFKEPFGLETLTSSKYITFMERSYIDNFSPDRHIGASFVNWGQYHYVTGGVFGQVAGTPDATGNSEGYAFTGRLVVVPVNTANALLHIGGAISRRTPDAASGADTNTV